MLRCLKLHIGKALAVYLVGKTLLVKQVQENGHTRNSSLCFVNIQGAAFSMVLRGTEKTVIDRKKVAYVF